MWVSSRQQRNGEGRAEDQLDRGRFSERSADGDGFATRGGRGDLAARIATCRGRRDGRRRRRFEKGRRVVSSRHRRYRAGHRGSGVERRLRGKPGFERPFGEAWLPWATGRQERRSGRGGGAVRRGGEVWILPRHRPRGAEQCSRGRWRIRRRHRRRRQLRPLHGALGDRDGDGIEDMAVGATTTTTGLDVAGWILFLATNGRSSRAKAHRSRAVSRGRWTTSTLRARSGQQRGPDGRIVDPAPVQSWTTTADWTVAPCGSFPRR